MRAAFDRITQSAGRIVVVASLGYNMGIMCATQDGLEERAPYGPTGRAHMVGPVGKGNLNPHAYDKPVMSRLWEVSEEATGFAWGL